MRVLIINNSNQVVASVPVVLQGMNYTPSDDEYFSCAWKCAVEDGLVDKDKRDEYQFSLARSE